MKSKDHCPQCGGPLPGGTPTLRATELLASDGMARLVEDMAKRYADRIIVLDTPPLLPVNDARLIAPHTDAVLLVVTAKRTKPSAVRAALVRLQLVGTRIVGVVLNESADGSAEIGDYYQTHQALEPSKPPLKGA